MEARALMGVRVLLRVKLSGLRVSAPPIKTNPATNGKSRLL
jgi:hypothetical protein